MRSNSVKEPSTRTSSQRSKHSIDDIERIKNEAKEDDMETGSIQHKGSRRGCPRRLDLEEAPPPVDTSKSLLLERRLLFGFASLLGFSILLWVTAICTDFWFVVSSPLTPGLFVNHTGRYFLTSNSGLFRICRTALEPPKNSTQVKIFKMCRYHDMFPQDTSHPAIDKTILDYTRTEIFFSLTSLILIIMGFSFSIYTFGNPRYMFKRLAAGIHFITCACILVVVEVLVNSIKYEKEHLPYVHPKGAIYDYGFSFYMAWLVFLVNLCTGCVFLWYSRKRKGDKAGSEEQALADEPTIIGR